MGSSQGGAPDSPGGSSSVVIPGGHPMSWQDPLGGSLGGILWVESAGTSHWVLCAPLVPPGDPPGGKVKFYLRPTPSPSTGNRAGQKDFRADPWPYILGVYRLGENYLGKPIAGNHFHGPNSTQLHLHCRFGFSTWPWIGPAVVLACTVVSRLARDMRTATILSSHDPGKRTLDSCLLVSIG